MKKKDYLNGVLVGMASNVVPLMLDIHIDNWRWWIIAVPSVIVLSWLIFYLEDK